MRHHDPTDRYWLVHANGGRQLIDPGRFDLDRVAEQARRVGGRLVVEADAHPDTPVMPVSSPPLDAEPGLPGADEAGPGPSRPPLRFEPPVSALGPLFRHRFGKLYTVQVDYDLEINTRPTTQVLGGYYKSRRLVRVYSHDRQTGRRPVDELFDTFLHEMAHHTEYTEPDSFHARGCERVPGRMHSRLFWRILGDLKARWNESQAGR